MTATPIRTLALTAALGLLASGAHAQSEALGKEIYDQRCAVCHGAEGAGDGIVGELFSQRPEDLRLLQKENGGNFPFVEVYKSIDGRTIIAGHGGQGETEMPIWGEFFMDEAIDDPRINEKDSKYVTAGRILSVIWYLQSIQTQ